MENIINILVVVNAQDINNYSDEYFEIITQIYSYNYIINYKTICHSDYSIFKISENHPMLKWVQYLDNKLKKQREKNMAILELFERLEKRFNDLEQFIYEKESDKKQDDE